MDQLFEAIGRNLFWVFAGVVAIVAIGLGMLKDIILSSAKERTRREIAAYIAEGAMTPEQGERLMKAGESEEC